MSELPTAPLTRSGAKGSRGGRRGRRGGGHHPSAARRKPDASWRGELASSSSSSDDEGGDKDAGERGEAWSTRAREAGPPPDSEDGAPLDLDRLVREVACGSWGGAAGGAPRTRDGYAWPHLDVQESPLGFELRAPASTLRPDADFFDLDLGALARAIRRLPPNAIVTGLDGEGSAVSADALFADAFAPLPDPDPPADDDRPRPARPAPTAAPPRHEDPAPPRPPSPPPDLDLDLEEEAMTTAPAPAPAAAVVGASADASADALDAELDALLDL